jgi:hypothetical protein
MNSLYPYLWVLLAYSALYLTVKYLYHWFMKDSETGVPSGETAESSGSGT